MTKALTAASVARFRKTNEPREIPDGACTGLYLLIYPSGRKSWALRYRRPGDNRTAKLTLGSVFDSVDGEPDIKPVIGGHLSLKSAHLLVAELKHEISLGRDPGLAHAAKKRAIATSDKFSGAAVDFIELHAKRETRRWKSTARYLGLQPKVDGNGLETIPKGLADRWRDKPINEIDTDLIHHVVDEAREKGVPGLARRRKDGPSESQALAMYAAISSMFTWMKGKRRLRQNPVDDVEKPKASRKRSRVLIDCDREPPDWAELILFWKATESLSNPFAPMLKLLLLTGCRLNEVAGMRRSELSDDGMVWIIPESRTKNKEQHTVFLPELARKLIASVETIGEFVFSTNERTPVAGFSKQKKKLDAVMLAERKIMPWVLHDIRRTTATGMATVGIAPHIVEVCLNHISGVKSGVAGVYNRAKYAAEKKAAFERWAAHIEGLVEGRSAGNVTSMRRRP
jgi:integrase